MHDTTFVDVSGARVAVHALGEGPPAVFVHGYPFDHRMWLDVLASPLASTNRLVAVDLRGHGMSPWARDAVHTMERFADDVAAAIEALGSGPAHVVGSSMGGYVALALCERRPDLVRSLALVDSRAAADTEAGKEGRLAAMAAAVNDGRRAVAVAMLERLLPRDADLTVRARIVTMIEAQPVETMVADLRGMRARADRTALLGSIAVPALVVVGALDEITPPDEAARMAQALAGARLVVVPDRGHMVPMEAPDVLVLELAAFWLGGN